MSGNNFPPGYQHHQPAQPAVKEINLNPLLVFITLAALVAVVAMAIMGGNAQAHEALKESVDPANYERVVALNEQVITERDELKTEADSMQAKLDEADAQQKSLQKKVTGLKAAASAAQNDLKKAQEADKATKANLRVVCEKSGELFVHVQDAAIRTAIAATMDQLCGGATFAGLLQQTPATLAPAPTDLPTGSASPAPLSPVPTDLPTGLPAGTVTPDPLLSPPSLASQEAAR